jgi:DNA-directed RNA polymerase subunit RPC12/RpoP
MGAVAMEERATGLVDRGYPVMEATLYIYCDDCGSFNIKTYVPVYKWVITLLIIAAVVLIYRQVEDWRWYLCLVPILFIGQYLPWRDIYLRYRCRNCGNKYISDFNKLQYPAYDKSIIDAPDHLTQKRYIETDVLHFHQFE